MEYKRKKRTKYENEEPDDADQTSKMSIKTSENKKLWSSFIDVARSGFWKNATNFMRRGNNNAKRRKLADDSDEKHSTLTNNIDVIRSPRYIADGSGMYVSTEMYDATETAFILTQKIVGWKV
nr:uncharacterized protein LOC124808188 [Hydra vulgaris]